MSARKPISEAEGPSLIGRLGLGLFLLSLVLAPAIGGFPAGMTYGQELLLAALRCLVLSGGICLVLSFSAARASGSRGDAVPALLLWLAFFLTLLSFLVHSRFLTSPSLLFAMLPSTLDWLCYALVFTLGMALSREKNGVLALAGALTVGGAWAAILGAMEYGQFVQSGFPAQRAQSPFFSPNFLAGFLGLTLPVVAALYLGVTQRLAVLGLGVVASLMAGTLVATGSRAGLVLAVGGLGAAFLLALLRRRGRLPWVRVGILLAAVALLGFGFRGPLTARGEGGGQEHSGAFRTLTWKGTEAMARANPLLGAGPGTFPYLYSRYALVGRTDLAHSSYLQLAAEQGYPALAAVVAALALTVGLAGWRILGSGPADSDTDSLPLLLACGLLGGVLTGMGRSFFDSEWSLLGNGLPFFSAAGAAVGLTGSFLSPKTEAVSSPSRQRSVSPAAFLLVPLLMTGLVFALLTLNSVRVRDAAQAALRLRERPDLPPGVWPLDPSLLAWQGRLEEAAAVEPSARRFYQLGRYYEQRSETEQAIGAFEKALLADPNSLQTWRKLAEIKQANGDPQGALDAWSELVKREEGLVGQNRAIPELREIHAAFAYAALADAARNNDPAQAILLYEKAARVLEEYSRTPPIYQQMEIGSAMATGVAIEERRQEVRSLYQKIISEWSKLEPARAGELQTRLQETLDRLDTFLSPPDQNAAGASETDRR